MRPGRPGYGWLFAVVLACAACGSTPGDEPAITTGDAKGWPDTLDIIEEIGGASDVSEITGLELLGCADDSECEGLDDGNLCNGLVLCLAGKCQVDPATVIECLPWDGPCVGETCVPETGECVVTVAPPDTECDDDDPCTTKDLCLEEICSGLEFVNCDDGNPCTADNCVDGACISDAVEVSCDDGNPCTAGDLCMGGECVPGGDLLDCDDDNACTDDACSSVEGCIYQANAKACEDGDPCTLGDQCIWGDCITGPGLLDCDDNNMCTSESCVPLEGCVLVEDPGGCDDGDPCTENLCDVGAGDCIFPTVDCGNLCLAPAIDQSGTECDCLPITCEDLDLCTFDTCQPELGCVFLVAVCDDENPCTIDSCQPDSGNCQYEPVMCDDDNPCTQDICYPQDGECVFTAAALDGASCTDGDDCTDPDLCLAGECTSGPDVCSELCSNGIDDNGDGAIDCDDAKCQDAEVCQEQECLVAATLQCGLVAISSLPGEGAGNLDGYPCSPYGYPGVERVFSYVSPCSGQVSFTVNAGMMGNFDAVLDVLVLDQATGCKPTSCLAAGLMSGDFIKQAKVTFQAEQGKAYYLAVEGREGDVGDFSVTSLCSCMWGGN